MPDKRGRSRWDSLVPYAKGGALNVVIETPAGSRNKYKFDPQLGVFCLSRVLPEGMSFPFDFGYVPGTLAEDGDPVDVLLLMDQAVFAGCLVQARLIGVIEAKQRDPGEKIERNDRLIAVATDSVNHRDVKSLSDLPDPVLEQVEQFFVSYHAQRGAAFRPLGRKGSKRAKALVEEGIRRRAAGKTTTPRRESDATDAGP